MGAAALGPRGSSRPSLITRTWQISCHLVLLMLLAPPALQADQLYHHNSFWELGVLGALMTSGILAGFIFRCRKQNEFREL